MPELNWTQFVDKAFSLPIYRDITRNKISKGTNVLIADFYPKHTFLDYLKLSFGNCYY